MSENKLRKSWTTQDNILLAETIVKVVNSGKTFSDAYREAGKLLGRSPFACEKQWRDKLKSKYISQIKKPTAATKKLKTNPKSNSNTNPIPKPINVNYPPRLKAGASLRKFRDITMTNTSKVVNISIYTEEAESVPIKVDVVEDELRIKFIKNMQDAVSIASEEPNKMFFIEKGAKLTIHFKGEMFEF